MKWKQGRSGKQSLETRRYWIKTPEQDHKRGEQILENKVTRMRQKTLEPERCGEEPSEESHGRRPMSNQDVNQVKKERMRWEEQKAAHPFKGSPGPPG